MRAHARPLDHAQPAAILIIEVRRTGLFCDCGRGWSSASSEPNRVSYTY